MSAGRTLHCYATEADGQWEAICLDLDIAVQGRSFQETDAALAKAIHLYLEEVAMLDDAEREALLSRRAPLWTRIVYAFEAFRNMVMTPATRRLTHQYTMVAA